MNIERRCFFIGHRETAEAVYENLYGAVLRHVEEYGVEEFIVGKYGSFDRMAAAAVIQAKKLYPNIRLILLQPYHPAVHADKLPNGFDGGYYPFSKPVPMRLAIVLANKKAIDGCYYLIACVSHPGKSRDFLDYARKREKRGLIRTVNVWEDKAKTQIAHP